MSKKCKCFSAPQYHREDCSEYDVHGKLKQSLIVTNNSYSQSNNEFQAKSRINRKPQDKTIKNIVIVDYAQKLGEHPLDPDQIKSLKNLKNDLDKLIKELDIKISI